jgi:hypothetical protein
LILAETEDPELIVEEESAELEAWAAVAAVASVSSSGIKSRALN